VKPKVRVLTSLAGVVVALAAVVPANAQIGVGLPGLPIFDDDCRDESAAVVCLETQQTVQQVNDEVMFVNTKLLNDLRSLNLTVVDPIRDDIRMVTSLGERAVGAVPATVEALDADTILPDHVQLCLLTLGRCGNGAGGGSGLLSSVASLF